MKLRIILTIEYASSGCLALLPVDDDDNTYSYFRRALSFICRNIGTLRLKMTLLMPTYRDELGDFDDMLQDMSRRFGHLILYTLLCVTYFRGPLNRKFTKPQHLVYICIRRHKQRHSGSTDFHLAYRVPGATPFSPLAPQDYIKVPCAWCLLPALYSPFGTSPQKQAVVAVYKYMIW